MILQMNLFCRVHILPFRLTLLQGVWFYFIKLRVKGKNFQDIFRRRSRSAMRNTWTGPYECDWFIVNSRTAVFDLRSRTSALVQSSEAVSLLIMLPFSLSAISLLQVMAFFEHLMNSSRGITNLQLQFYYFNRGHWNSFTVFCSANLSSA